MAGIQVVHVAYKGSTPAATDLVGGQIQFVFEAIGAGVQYVKSGRLRAMGVSTIKRSQTLPELATIAEQGVPGYEMSTWHTVCAARGRRSSTNSIAKSWPWSTHPRYAKNSLPPAPNREAARLGS